MDQEESRAKDATTMSGTKDMQSDGIQSNSVWNLESAIVQDKCSKFFNSKQRNQSQHTLSKRNTMVGQMKQTMKDEEDDDIHHLMKMKSSPSFNVDNYLTRPTKSALNIHMSIGQLQRKQQFKVAELRREIRNSKLIGLHNVNKRLK